LEKTLKKDKSSDRFTDYRVKSDSITLQTNTSDQLRHLESRLAALSKENESLEAEKGVLEEEARQLRLTISRL
jgi:TolA-binding protein